MFTENSEGTAKMRLSGPLFILTSLGYLVDAHSVGDWCYEIDEGLFYVQATVAIF